MQVLLFHTVPDRLIQMEIPFSISLSPSYTLNPSLLSKHGSKHKITRNHEQQKMPSYAKSGFHTCLGQTLAAVAGVAAVVCYYSFRQRPLASAVGMAAALWSCCLSLSSIRFEILPEAARGWILIFQEQKEARRCCLAVGPEKRTSRESR